MITSNSHSSSPSDNLYRHTGRPVQLTLTSHFEIQRLYSYTVSDELNDPLPEAPELVMSLEAL